MANISKEVNIDMLEKLADGSYKKKNPSTKAEQVKFKDGATVESHKAEKATQSKLGHIKAGTNVTILEDGTLNAKGGNVDSVNGKTGIINIDVEDIPGLSDTDITLGYEASAGNDAIALGWKASAARSQSIALGRSANAAWSQAMALGYEASAAGSSAIALGLKVSAAGSSAVALGRSASAAGDYEGVLGVASDRIGPYIWKVPGSFSVSGTKNFEIPHPNPSKSATHTIRHGAVESPSAGDTLYRYKVQSTKENDLQTIELPDYFIYLNKDVQVFVTPQGHFGNGYGDLNRETEQLEIHCEDEGKYNVLVVGTRNDDHSTVQNWDIMGVEKEIGVTWEGETYSYEIEEIREVEEIKEGY